MTNSNTVADPTLNVNSTGAKAIKCYGTTAPGTAESTSWIAGAVLSFTYDGTNWVMNDFSKDTLNTAGLVLKGRNNNGSEFDITTGYTCDPTALDTVGTQEITVTYEGKTAKFNVTVVEVTLDRILKKHGTQTIKANIMSWCVDIFQHYGNRKGWKINEN